MTPSELIDALSEEQVYEEWMGGNLNDALTFHGLIFMFDKYDTYGPLNDGKMDYLVLQERDDVYFWDRPLAEWSRNAIEGCLTSSNLPFDRIGKSTVNIPPLSLSLTFDADQRLFALAASNT